MVAKLKVFATRIGFHDAVVAAPSQAAALAAWDIRENLFAQGTATITTDPNAVEAAIAHPGVVLRRAAGSDQAFSEAPAAPEVPKIKLAKEKPAKGAAAKPAKPPPDRRPLDAAEKALADLDAEEKRAADDLARRRRDLDAEEREQGRAFTTRRRDLEKARDRARSAFEREA